MALGKRVQDIVNESKNPLLGKGVHWERVPLEFISIVLNGFAFKSANFSKEKGVPLIRIRDVGKKTTDVLYDGPYDDMYSVEPGDIIIGMDGDFKSNEWLGERALLNQRVCKLENISELYSKKFLKYVLPGYLNAINTETSSVTVKHLSSKSVYKIPLPLPPLPEQHRIVAKIEELFTKLDAGVEALKQVQAQLKRYRQSVLKAAVEGRLTSEWRKQRLPASLSSAQASKDELEPADKLLERILKERRENWAAEQLAKYKTQGKTPPNNWKDKYKEPTAPDTSNLPELPEGWVWSTPNMLSTFDQNAICAGPFGTIFKAKDFRDEGIPIIFLRHVSPGKYITRKPGFMDNNKWYDLFQSYSVFGGELLITKLGEPPGICAIYPTGIGPAMVTPDVIKMSVNNAILSRFIMHFLNSDIARKFTFRIAFGTTRPRMTLPIFRNMPVPLPSKKEQAKIVEEIDLSFSIVDRIEITIISELKRAQSLRQSILKCAFEGKLVPQNPNDLPASVLLERIKAEKARIKKNYLDYSRAKIAVKARSGS